MIGYPDWTRAIRLTGVDADGDPVTVLLDEDGNLQAILKGDYEGTPTAIAVDGDGRITAYMADSEDQWGLVLETGNAEQAARLGSPVSWDRRGQVQIIHTFGNGMESLKTTIGENGAAVALDPTRHRSGGYSLKMTSGSLQNFNLITVEGFAGVSPSSRYGLAVCFSLDGAVDYLTILVARFDGTNDHNGSIRYDYDSGKLQVLDGVSGWTDFATVPPYATEYVFHQMKVVTDIDTDMYVRALFDGTEYDLSAYALSVGTVVTADHLRYYCMLTGHIEENEVAYLDSIIVTAAEP